MVLFYVTPDGTIVFLGFIAYPRVIVLVFRNTRLTPLVLCRVYSREFTISSIMTENFSLLLGEECKLITLNNIELQN